MGKRMKFSEEQEAELEAAIKKNKDKRADKRLCAVLLYARGEKRKTIAQQTGFEENWLCTLAVKYQRGGLEALTGNHYGGKSPQHES
jgi:transposase